jgi:hypothetical protein
MSDDQTARQGRNPLAGPVRLRAGAPVRMRAALERGRWSHRVPGTPGRGLSAADVPTVEAGETDADESGRDQGEDDERGQGEVGDR